MTTDDLPPTQKGRHHEIRAMGFRDFEVCDDPNSRLTHLCWRGTPSCWSCRYDQIEPLLTDETKKHLIGEGKDMWSGGAASQPLPDGRKLIITESDTPADPPSCDT